jgi:uncharacterized protein
MRLIRKRTFLIGVIVVAIVLLLLGVWSLFIEPNRLVVHQYDLNLPRSTGAPRTLKIAALSDLHIGSPFIDLEKLDQIIAKTNEAKPDVVLLLGDFMVQDRFYKSAVDPEVFAPALGKFEARLGVYSILGNHDWWFDGLRVRKALEAAGVRVLENETAKIENDGGAVWLVGLADLWTGPQKVSETLALVPQGSAKIVITHNPDLFPRLPENVELTLAGHTHGGQVCLPLVGRLVVPSDFGQRYAAGYVREGNKQLIVSTGIGTSILPIRFGVTPEIVIINVSAGS